MNALRSAAAVFRVLRPWPRPRRLRRTWIIVVTLSRPPPPPPLAASSSVWLLPDCTIIGQHSSCPAIPTTAFAFHELRRSSSGRTPERQRRHRVTRTASIPPAASPIHPQHSLACCCDCRRHLHCIHFALVSRTLADGLGFLNRTKPTPSLQSFRRYTMSGRISTAP